MEGKHIVGVVSILVVGAIVVAVLAMHPWRGEENRDRREHHEDQTAVQQQAAADAQVAAQNAQAAQNNVAPAPVVAAPGAYDVNGQALTTVFPTEDTVDVYEDNAWVPARITRREQGRVYVEYDGKGGHRNDWVTAQHVRAHH